MSLSASLILRCISICITIAMNSVSLLFPCVCTWVYAHVCVNMWRSGIRLRYLPWVSSILLVTDLELISQSRLADQGVPGILLIPVADSRCSLPSPVALFWSSFYYFFEVFIQCVLVIFTFYPILLAVSSNLSTWAPGLELRPLCLNIKHFLSWVTPQVQYLTFERPNM